jgi:hypothetical protein
MIKIKKYSLRFLNKSERIYADGCFSGGILEIMA